ncbi:MAG TPA: phage recombination protein Bet [Ktedonobacterales bacterium]|nr:phage recombination protein Bet [Ktedonobacterales bacterium]
MGETNDAALMVAPQQQLQQAFGREQLDLIKRTVASGTSDDEFALFVEVCKRTGLDPFSHQIYAIMRSVNERQPDGSWRKTQRMTIQTGIDGYRALAARTRSLAGIDDAIFDTEEADHPNKATVTVYRWSHGQRAAFTATARWREYVQTDKEGKPTGQWGKMPYLMLGKCAEALALRKAFPAELSGVYTNEEMMQADSGAPVVEAVATQSSHTDARQQGHTTPAPKAAPTAGETVTQRGIKLLGEQGFLALCQHMTGTTDAKKMTPQQRAAIATHIAELEAAREAGDFPPEVPAATQAKPARPATIKDLSALRRRSLALGYETQESWERLMASVCHKTNDLTTADVALLDKHLTEQEAVEAQAAEEAAVV